MLQNVPGVVAYFVAPEAEGHGTDAMIEAFHLPGGGEDPKTGAVHQDHRIGLDDGNRGVRRKEGPIAQIGSGIGMIPRGEVGLIIASVGASLVLEGEKVIGATTYSAVVIMVIVTTLVAPPLLKWTLTDRKAVTPLEDGA